MVDSLISKVNQKSRQCDQQAITNTPYKQHLHNSNIFYYTILLVKIWKRIMSGNRYLSEHKIALEIKERVT